MSEDRFVSIIVIPDEARDGGRTFRLTHRRFRLLKWVGAFGLIAVALLAGSWGYMAIQVARVEELEAELTELRVDREALAVLSTELEEIEGRYRTIRSLFGVDTLAVASNLWMPPPSGRSSSAESDEPGNLPNSWPLTVRGFVTQVLLEGVDGAHPGLDIAVPSDTYVRAAGGGTVLEVGEDEIYGRYVVIDHGSGYQSRYAHASQTLVSAAQRVRRNEVIALSGSTGRSTAPHLHFEIRLNGEAVNPLTMVRQP